MKAATMSASWPGLVAARTVAASSAGASGRSSIASAARAFS
jgi:hypothetical protein